MRTVHDLKARRIKAGWSQRQLAERAGVHCQTVKYWEGQKLFIAGWAVDRFEQAFAAAKVPVPLPWRSHLSEATSRNRPYCGARNRKGEPCKARALPGKKRCKFHGGMSTGPRTPEGRARIADAQRKRWEAALRRHRKPGHCLHVWYQHDDWCGIYAADALCNCNPHRVLTNNQGRVLARVEGAGFFDPLEFSEAYHARR